MSEFINTADVIGDDEMCDQIIQRTVTEYKESRITKVGDYAFHGCTELTKADCPNATSIGDEGFNYCYALSEMNFPLVDNIGSYAFNRCYKLQRISLPELTTCGKGSFSNNTDLVEAIFPKLRGGKTEIICNCANLSKIDFYALEHLDQYDCSGCTSLNTLIIRSATACSMTNSNALNNTPIASGSGYIYVPRSLVDSYKAASNWSTYAAQFRALEDYTVDGTITGDLDESKI